MVSNTNEIQVRLELENKTQGLIKSKSNAHVFYIYT